MLANTTAALCVNSFRYFKQYFKHYHYPLIHLQVLSGVYLFIIYIFSSFLHISIQIHQARNNKVGL